MELCMRTGCRVKNVDPHTPPFHLPGVLQDSSRTSTYTYKHTHQEATKALFLAGTISLSNIDPASSSILQASLLQVKTVSQVFKRSGREKT